MFFLRFFGGGEGGVQRKTGHQLRGVFHNTNELGSIRHECEAAVMSARTCRDRDHGCTRDQEKHRISKAWGHTCDHQERRGRGGLSGPGQGLEVRVHGRREAREGPA